MLMREETSNAEEQLVSTKIKSDELGSLLTAPKKISYESLITTLKNKFKREYYLFPFYFNYFFNEIDCKNNIHQCKQCINKEHIIQSNHKHIIVHKYISSNKKQAKNYAYKIEYFSFIY